MASKKDFTQLKVKEAAMAAQAARKRKRLATILAEDPKFCQLNRGQRQDLSAMATRKGDATPQRSPMGEIPIGIPLADILGGRPLSIDTNG